MSNELFPFLFKQHFNTVPKTANLEKQPVLAYKLLAILLASLNPQSHNDLHHLDLHQLENQVQHLGKAMMWKYFFGFAVHTVDGINFSIFGSLIVSLTYSSQSYSFGLSSRLR